MVSGYKNILVTVDISKEAEFILIKVKQIADSFDAKVSVIHIIEPIIIDYSIDLIPSFNEDIQNSLIKRSEIFLKQTLKKVNLPSASFAVKLGTIKYEIHREAIDKSIDLIVIGTHGRHGISRFLGSTANAVLHGAPCDVLTVKIR